MCVWWGTEEDEASERNLAPIRQGADCFYCGEMLEFPAVEWDGTGVAIYLHPRCAAKLSAGLMMDWKRAEDGRASALREQEWRNAGLSERVQLASQMKIKEQLLELSQASIQRLMVENRELKANLDAEQVRLEKEMASIQKELERRSQEAPAVRVDPQRAFSHAQKKEIYLRANGHCVGCGTPLDSDWHADHIVPHARGGRTEIVNGQALCQPCNSRKHAKVLTVDGD